MENLFWLSVCGEKGNQESMAIISYPFQSIPIWLFVRSCGMQSYFFNKSIKIVPANPLWSHDFCQEWSNKSESIPASICLLKVSNRNTRTKCGICSKLINFRRSGVFIVNFEHISNLVLLFLLLTLKM